MAGKMLIVYYSQARGNTRRIAKQLQAATGADLVEIETVTPYTGSYQEIVEQGNREVQSGYKPQIKPLTLRPEDYDIIAIGTPTWWYTMAPAVLTFLNEHSWQGKTIIPFQTHGGWPGHVIKDIRQICKGASFANEMEVQFDSTGGSELITKEKDIERWIEAVKKENF